MWDALWRIVLRGAYLTLRTWWWIRHPEVHGAYVAVWRDDHLLLIRNSYRPGETVPCGAIHTSESPVTAAVRELGEEVGILVHEADLRFVRECVVDFEYKIDHAHFFELRIDPAMQVRVDNREVIWAEFISAGELAARPLVPHVRAYLEGSRPLDSSRSQSAT